MDYFKEIQAKTKRCKNGKKPQQFIIPQEEESENYLSTSKDEVIDIKPEYEENSENSCIEEILENKNVEDTFNELTLRKDNYVYFVTTNRKTWYLTKI